MDDLNLANFDLGDGEELEAANLAADIKEDTPETVHDVTVEEVDSLDNDGDGLQTVSSEGSSEINIEREMFNKFINCVKLIVDSDCTDCDIVNGVIRQMANNRRSVIKVNLSGILGDVDLPISNAQQKVALLKTFELDDSVEDEGGVVVKIEDKIVSFTDNMGHVSFNKPLRRLLDNKHMSDEEFDKRIEISDEKLIIETTITNYIAKRRIKSICDVVKSDVIKVKMNGPRADVCIKGSDINSTVLKIEGDDVKKDLPKSSFEMLLLPFAMDVASDIQFRVYKMTAKKLLCTFDLVYMKVPVSIYMITQVDK